MTDCIHCGALLVEDRRWRIVKAMAPRFPACDPPTEACFRGLANRLGAKPSDSEVTDAVRRAKGLR